MIHRQGRHQNRAKAGRPRRRRRVNGSSARVEPLAREGDDQDCCLAVATPMHMMAPVSAGT